jgi:hypothetical protein
MSKESIRHVENLLSIGLRLHSLDSLTSALNELLLFHHHTCFIKVTQQHCKEQIEHHNVSKNEQ